MITFEQYFLSENQKLGDEREWNTDPVDAWSSVQEYMFKPKDDVSQNLENTHPTFNDPNEIPLDYIGYLVGDLTDEPTNTMEVGITMYYFEDPATGKLYSYDAFSNQWGVIALSKQQLLGFLRSGSRWNI